MITKDIELPLKPAEKASWVGGSVLRMVTTQAIRSFNVYEFFALLVVLATSISAVMGHSLDSAWYAFGIFTIAVAVSVKYIEYIKLEHLPKKDK